MTKKEKLIKAAPDMLAALKEFAENMETWFETGEVLNAKDSEKLYDKCIAAIKKATP